MRACVLSHFSRVQLFATLWTVAHRDPQSMGFSRQEYWSGLLCPPPGDPPNPGVKPASLMSPALAGGFFTTNFTWEVPHIHTHVLKPSLEFLIPYHISHFLSTHSLSCIYSGLHCHSSFKTHSNHLKVSAVPTHYAQENFLLNICMTHSFTPFFFTKCLFKMSFLTTLFIISITALHAVHLFI